VQVDRVAEQITGMVLQAMRRDERIAAHVH